MSNAHLFRSFSKIEDRLIRACCPRTNASDPWTSAAFAPRVNGRTVAPLTYTLQEVARG